MSQNTQFQLAISGTGLLFTKEISYEQMREITALVLGEKAETKLENKISQSNTIEKTVNVEERSQGVEIDDQSEIKLELSTFIEKSKAERSPDKVAAFGYYLLKNQNMTRFEKADLIKLFEEARLSLPKNLNRDIRWAEKNGWIAEVPKEEGVFYLTQEGIEVVEAKFPQKIRKKTVNAATK